MTEREYLQYLANGATLPMDGAPSLKQMAEWALARDSYAVAATEALASAVAQFERFKGYENATRIGDFDIDSARKLLAQGYPGSGDPAASNSAIPAATNRTTRFCPACHACNGAVGEVGSGCWTPGCGGQIASGSPVNETSSPEIPDNSTAPNEDDHARRLAADLRRTDDVPPGHYDDLRAALKLAPARRGRAPIVIPHKLPTCDALFKSLYPVPPQVWTVAEERWIAHARSLEATITNYPPEQPVLVCRDRDAVCPTPDECLAVGCTYTGEPK